jgi:DNA repair exonuclease SbcCD ATPase subunit
MSPKIFIDFGGDPRVAAGDIFWDEVAEVRTLGAQPTFDLTVGTSDHVYVAGTTYGHNSALIEAVSVALWGETLRGASPWREGEVGYAEVVTDLARATRAVSKVGKKTLTWSPVPGDGAVNYETTTKAQEALERVVGPFDVWRRACVFSGSDAAHFTRASDAERKRLLESMLGLDIFDAALERCRVDLRGALARHERVSSDKNLTEAAADAAARRVSDARSALGNLNMPREQPAGVLEQLARDLAQTDQEYAAARRHLSELERATGAREAEAEAAEKFASGLARAGATCPTCRQPLSERHLERVRREAREARVAADAEMAKVADQLATTREDVAERAEEHSHFAGRLAAAEQAAKELARWGRVRAGLDRSAAQALHEAAQARARAEELSAAVGEHGGRAALLGVAERVLGLRGLRAHVLGRALDGLEDAANVWLSRVAGEDLRLKLSPYQERASGGLREVIGLSVAWPSGGRTYASASAGERRRVDVALMLALGDVAMAAYGRSGATLFVDEVLDSPLDAEGRSLVARALREIARDRCVVVVSHEPSVARDLEPVLRLRVVDGKAEVA